MVIVDSDVVFIHFYLTAAEERTNSDVEKISSTLQITSKSVAEEFIKIYEKSESDDATIFAKFKVEDMDNDDSDKDSIIMNKFIKVAKRKLYELNDWKGEADKNFEDNELEDVINLIAGMCIIRDFNEIKYLEQFYMKGNTLVKNTYIRKQIEDKIRIVKGEEN